MYLLIPTVQLALVVAVCCVFTSEYHILLYFILVHNLGYFKLNRVNDMLLIYVVIPELGCVFVADKDCKVLYSWNPPPFLPSHLPLPQFQEPDSLQWGPRRGAFTAGGKKTHVQKQISTYSRSAFVSSPSFWGVSFIYNINNPFPPPMLTFTYNPFPPPVLTFFSPCHCTVLYT